MSQLEMTKFSVVYETWTTANFFVFPFGIERRRCMFSLSTFLEPLAYRTDLDNRDFRLQIITSFFLGVVVDVVFVVA